MSTELIARTGRVQSWIDDPTSRLPVSCTVFVIEDSMEGPEGIEGIEAQLTPEGYKGFLQGNCAKYLWRWRDEGGIEDLRKCKWYLDRLISSVDEGD